MTLLDPTYAKKYIPIIASVSEHQPTTWSSYFFDLQYLIVFMIPGFYLCFTEKVTIGKLFVALYGLLAVYFSCVMIRLMLVVAPAACVLASIGISYLIRKMAKAIRNGMQNDGEDDEADDVPQRGKKPASKESKKKSFVG